MSSVDGVLAQLLAGLGGSGTEDIRAQLSAQADQLRAATQEQADAMAESFTAVASRNTATDSGNSTALDIASGVAKTLGAGLGMGTLIGGLVNLFGGGGDATPPPVEVYPPPAPLEFDGSVNRSAGTTGWSAPEPTGRGQIATAAPQITVQVNAMDSRSFLDHSDEIANAVRRAMLDSHALNDVVSEL